MKNLLSKLAAHPKLSVFGATSLYAALASYLALAQPLAPQVQTLLLIPFVFLLPGYLTLAFITRRRLVAAKTAVYSLLLSLLVLMAIGFVSNAALPAMGFTEPLRPNVIVPALAAYILGSLLLLLRLRAMHELVLVKLKGNYSVLRTLPFIVGPLLALLAFFGANSLNNGGTNAITIVSIVGALAYAVWAFVSKDESLKKWMLYWVGFGALLMLSVRSSYISGFDISREFQLFTATAQNNFWQLAANRDPYSACLSITVLPTLIHNIIGISPEYVYKIVFQGMFAALPVITYMFGRRYLKPNLALLAGLLLVAQPWFIDPMVQLMRQEVALVLFGGCLLAIFDGTMAQRQRVILFILLAVGLIVSHYSTAYVTLFFLLALFPVNRVVTGKWSLRGVRPTIALILLLFTFLWNTQITSSSKNISIVIRDTMQSIPNAFNAESRSGIVGQVLNLGGTNTHDLNLSDEATESRTLISRTQPSAQLYEESAYQPYSLLPVPAGAVNPVREPWYTGASWIFKGLLVLIAVSTLFGMWLLRKKVRNSEAFKEYLPLALTGVLALVAIVSLPYVSKAYNFDRLYMQIYIFLVPVTIMGMYALFKMVKNSNKMGMALSLLAVLLVFSYTKGLVWQSVGGKPDMWLNNYGAIYNATYVHQGEVLAADWMQHKSEHGRLVYADAIGRNILTAYGDDKLSGHTVTGLFPQLIQRQSYVFLTNAAVNENIGFYNFRGAQIGYLYPKAFLDTNKNNPYSNRTSVIYE